MDDINENHQDQAQGNQHLQGEKHNPDYIAMQYRVLRTESGWKPKKERIGAAFNNANGSICFRPTGRQLIENDIYLFPANDESEN